MIAVRSHQEWATMTVIERIAAIFNESSKHYALALFYNRGLELSESSALPQHPTIEWLCQGNWDWVIWREAEFDSALANGTLDDVHEQLAGTQPVSNRNDNFYLLNPQSTESWDDNGVSTPSADWLPNSLDQNPSYQGEVKSSLLY